MEPMTALERLDSLVDASTQITSGKVLRRRARTRDNLLRVSAMRFVADGVENVTIDDIVEEADIARGTFYSLFESKEDLIKSIIHPVFENAIVALDSLESSGSQELLRGVLEIYATLWEEMPHALLLAFRINRKFFYLLQELHDPFAHNVAEIFQCLEKAKILRTTAREGHRLLGRCAIEVLYVIGENENWRELFIKSMEGLLLRQPQM